MTNHCTATKGNESVETVNEEEEENRDDISIRDKKVSFK